MKDKDILIQVLSKISHDLEIGDGYIKDFDSMTMYQFEDNGDLFDSFSFNK